MYYRVFEGGAIACSAVALWSWTTSSHPIPPSLCQPTPPQNSPHRQTRQPNCSSSKSIRQSGILPAALFNLGWGRDRLSPDLEQVYTQVLADAQKMADQNRLPDAILALGGIPKNSQKFTLAQQMQNDWAQELLQQATQHYSQADLKTALKLLASIPTTSPSFQQAKTLSAQWRQEASWLYQAQASAQAGRWQAVLNALKRLEDRPLYQSTLVQTLLQSMLSRVYQPDDRLLRATSSLSSSAAAIRIQMPKIPAVANSLETIPDSNKLEIETTQALTWAQPQKPSAIAQVEPPKVREQTSTESKERSPAITPLFPVKSPQHTATEQLQKPAIAPPESFSIEGD